MARIDATAALKYIICLGGRKAAFTLRIQQMQELLRTRHIQLLAGHVKGEENPADAPSRRMLGITEYKLSKTHFHSLQRMWGPFGLDACAASWNCQLPRYLSRQRSDSEAVGHDVLSFPLQEETEVVYIFPPTHKILILQILKRIRAARAEVVLILPAWADTPTAEALTMIVDDPVIMECTQELLEPPQAYGVHLAHKAPQRWWTRGKWQAFLGMRLSGNAEKAEAFSRAWQTRLRACTRRDEMETTLLHRSARCAPVSEKCTPTAQLVCRMLSLAT
jgi:hypothetical protein